MAKNPTNRVCRLLNTPQGCNYGSNCKFSHEIGTQTGRPFAHAFSSLSEWRLLIPTRPGINLRPIDFPRFCKVGLELVQGDYATKQDCILLLASENGLGRVKQMLEQETKRTTNSGGRYFEDELLPLFTILAHPDVVTSATLETALVNIYNIIYGPQGARASVIFQFVAQMVIDWPSSQADLQNNFKTILHVFVEVITKNGSAHINPQLVPAAEILFDKATEMSQDVRNQHGSKVRQLAEKLNRQLNMGRSMPVALQQVAKPVQKRAHFAQEQPPPGSRHDNDHVDIRKIKIMPTYDEVRSHQIEYLPVRGEQRGGPEGLQRLLDHHFRLLREDTVGQLRDAVRATLQATVEHGATAATGPRTHTYDHFGIVDVFFSRPSGLEFFVRVNQPLRARNLTDKQRKDWWERSNSLQIDALVCIVDLQGSDVYCTVLAHGPGSSSKPDRGHQVSEQEQDNLLVKYNGFDLHSKPDGAYLTLKPVSREEKDLLPLLRAAFGSNGKQDCKLVEFPGVLLPAFEPTLLALQNMLTTQDMPFSEILTAGPDEAIQVPPPAYAADPNFFFDLACLIESKDRLPFFPRRDFDMSKLLTRSTLDEAQGDALIHCLRSSLALIQGPPGTGKSFTGIALIKVLLQAKKKAKLGPIICVCYTNHALDQLLEHLHAAGVEQMIRVGSRSKSDVLEEINLRKVAQQGEQTRAEKHAKWELAGKLDGDLRQVNDLLRHIRDVQQPKVLEAYLQSQNESHYRQMFSSAVKNLDDDKDGWQKVHRKHLDVVEQWLREGPEKRRERSRNVGQLQSVPLNAMSAQERHTLYEHWLHEIRDATTDDILTASHSFQQTNDCYNSVRREIDLRCLQDANVIGITTTGLARNLAVLRKLQAKVLVCEEAGEVLEAHVLTALLPSLEHVILIGDHQQLRPQVQNYELSRENDRGKKYSLNLSLFERLVEDPDGLQSRIPFCTLRVQRRMHPSVSQLIRKTSYPHLKDAQTVSQYPEVVGMKKRLFWLNHTQPEENASKESASGTSHSNAFEVNMVTSLVDHLVRQGAYQPGEIAVLTPYLAQLFKIRKALSQVMEVTIGERDVADGTRHGFELDETPKKEQCSTENAAMPQIKKTSMKTSLLKAMRVATIDNFQGEEAKVVIISLVRSNSQGRCGFLRTSNRINVLISRAQHGMYIIGNAETAGNKVPMWTQVLNMLQESGNLATSLQLQCPRHPDTPINVSNPEEFVVMSPEGGCGLLCDRRLECGHPCRHKCHSDVLHAAVVCLEACPRPLKGCDHSCPNPCGHKCPRICNVILDGQAVTLPCGHEIINPACWQSQHPDLVQCNEVVKKQVPFCDHLVDTRCCVDITADDFRCPAICGQLLSCSHLCQRKCYQCCQRSNGSFPVAAAHGKCLQVCSRKYDACSHSCFQHCHGEEPCAPCPSPCTIRCAHSKCTKKCSEPCAPCASPACSSECPHSKCTMPCAAPCNWLPCGERCVKVLECGHQCPSLCGEVCPTSQYCQLCADVDVKGQCVDMIMMQSFADIDLNQTACIIPRCGHILTIETMDGMMSMSDFYKISQYGKAVALKSKLFDLSQKVPACPSCRGPLRDVNRYGRIVRQALLAESTKKFINWSNSEYVPLAQRLQRLQEKLSESGADAMKRFANVETAPVNLSDSMSKQINAMHKATFQTRYKDFISAMVEISTYFNKVSKEEQPLRRVWDLVQHKRRTEGKDIEGFEYDSGVLQTRQFMLASALRIRCHLAVVCDFLSRGSINIENSSVKFSVNKRDCDLLSTLAVSGTQPAIQAEAYIFFGRYCAAEQFFLTTVRQKLTAAGNSEHRDLDDLQSRIESLRTAGLGKIEEAKVVCNGAPGSTAHITKELEQIENMIRNSTVSDILPPEEMKAVYDAMSREFGGTGHWYRCLNGHLFTIGECGMPMRVARCPQCGARIGGQNHQPVAGVTNAMDLEQQMQNMRL